MTSDDYSFCESVHAAGHSPWHLRKLTETGPKYGGGADTPALCGRTVAWDMDVTITPFHLTQICKACAAAYRKE